MQRFLISLSLALPLVLSVQLAAAQKVKLNTPGAVSEADYYVERKILYSSMLKIGFSRRVLDLQTERVSFDGLAISNEFAGLKQALANARQHWGKFMIVKTFPNATWGDTLILNRQLGRLVRVPDLSQSFRLVFESTIPIDSALQAFSSIPYVAYVHPPTVFFDCSAPNDPAYGQQWELQAIQAPMAWAITKGNPAVLTAVVDDGQLNHPDLLPKVVGGDGLSSFDNDHGTAVAGVLAAVTDNGVGVASLGWNLNLLTYLEGGSGSNRAANIYAAHSLGARVINLSWACATYRRRDACENRTQVYVAWPEDDPDVHLAVTTVQNAGNPSICVAAAGDVSLNWTLVDQEYLTSDCDPSKIPYPAYPAYYSTIAVSGTWQVGTTEDSIPGYNYGSYITVAAPSWNVQVLKMGPQIYKGDYGTSFGAPQVSALVGLMLSLDSTLTPAQIKNILTATADKVGNQVYVNGRNDHLGYGRINAHSALLQVVANLATQNLSSIPAAIAGNNQRKLYREPSGTLHEVFESGDEVYYRRWNASTQNWDITSMLSPGSTGSNAPCITMAGNAILVICQRLTGGSYSIEVSRSTNGGSSWSSLPSLGSYTCDSPGPMPTISALGNSVFAAYRTSSGGMMWNRSLDGGATWNAAGTVPGTSATCNNPSSLMYNTYWTVPQANLAYATDIPTGSPRIYYKWFDFDLGNWGSAIDLTAIVPSEFSNHANPCLAVSPNTSGVGDVHTAWDAALVLPPTRVIIHRKNPFRSSGSVYNVLGDYGWTKPTISCVGENLLWMLCQNSSSGAIWRRYYNGTTWGAGTTVTGSGRDPQLSVQFGGTTASAKYLYTTGSQSPFPVVLGSETLSKTIGDVVYTRALNVIDSVTRSSVTMELGVPQIETKSGARIPISFTWDINDSVKFDLAMLLNSGATEGFTLPTDAASLILPVAIYGKDASVVFGNNVGSLEVGVTDSRGGSTLATIGKTLSTAVQDGRREPSEIRLPLNGALTKTTLMKLVPVIGGIRTDRNLIFSLGHMYRTVDGDSLGKGILAKADPLPNDYGLSQNYPNPFNPTTQIRFAMPAGGNVSLVVYDVLGREIVTLTRGFQGAGYHTVTWNASSVASGVYFAQLTVTDELGQVKFNRTNKLILAK